MRRQGELFPSDKRRWFRQRPEILWIPVFSRRPELRSAWVCVQAEANERRAHLTGDLLALSREDLCRVAGRADVRNAFNVLAQLASVRRPGPVVSPLIRLWEADAQGRPTGEPIERSVDNAVDNNGGARRVAAAARHARGNGAAPERQWVRYGAVVHVCDWSKDQGFPP